MTSLRNAFWVAALGVIACYAFFFALGAFSPGEVAWLSIGVAVLAALWFVHSWLMRHAETTERDVSLLRARERRGF